MGFPLNEKPLICQAGSAEAFAGSSATGREHRNYTAYETPVKLILKWMFKRAYEIRPG